MGEPLPRTEGPPGDPTGTPREDRVPIGSKIAYGMGSANDLWGHWVYPGLTYTVFNIYLGVAPAYIGLVNFLIRIFDAVSDPFFGWVSDNTRTRFGRRRPFILVGAVLAGIGMPFLFTVGHGWGASRIHLNLLLWAGDLEVSHYVWYMLASSAVFIPVMSCFNMPYQSLGAELTPDYHERTSVMSWKSGLQKVAEFTTFFSPYFITSAVFVGATHRTILRSFRLLATTSAAWSRAAPGEQPNMLQGAQVYFTLLGALMALIGILIFLFVRERYYGQVVSRNQARTSLKESLWRTLRCKPFLLQLCMKMPYALSTNLLGVLGWYDVVYYVSRGDVAEGSWVNLQMGFAGVPCGVLGAIVFGAAARRFGKLAAMKLVLASALLAFGTAYWTYSAHSFLLRELAMGGVYFSGTGFWMMDSTIGADVMDYDELQTGKRREGAFSSCGSWITKVGLAVGSGCAGFVLAATGFDAKLGGAQSAHAIFNIRFFLSAFPVVGIALSFLPLAFFPLTQSKMAEIRRELEARRGTV
jgi:GPH family glycoside/pentoside/hexuronide:cation symporter